MGRKPKNKFSEALLAFDEIAKIKVFDIQIPFVYKFTVTPIGQAGYYEWEYHIKKPEDVPLVAADLERQDYNVIKTEPSVRKLTDLCPKCRRHGTPKIEKKDSHDRRARRPTHLGEVEKNKVYSKRQEEYWLVYTHPRHKKCRIRQYVNTPDPAYKKNDIEIEKYFFPHILEEMKKGSIWYADHPQ